MAAELEGLRILVVEDEYLVAMEIGEIVQELGGEVVGPVGRLEPAREAARLETIDGAVLDLNLKGVGSHPLADDLIALEIPFILTTGFAREHLADRLRHLPHLEKPFDEEVLKALIGSTFRRN